MAPTGDIQVPTPADRVRTAGLWKDCDHSSSSMGGRVRVVPMWNFLKAVWPVRLSVRLAKLCHQRLARAT